MYQSFAWVEVYSKWKVLKLQYEEMFWMEAAEGIPGNSAIIVEYSQLQSSVICEGLQMHLQNQLIGVKGPQNMLYMQFSCIFLHLDFYVLIFLITSISECIIQRQKLHFSLGL